ncbi:DUF5655 domain-containing protein [Borrelia sp. RT5S]|uniref:DUF5655 domain-containing protein n=1 Tax=Borrelia sp. RT5S TaxID=2898581 RepID=UPI001E37B7EB|nr:DUF5655 domain-containing protein [Borrelia sp. RT5S]UGQ15798.1 hypothetical protein LSO06_00440 [Borrelia sp. RT5S]
MKELTHTVKLFKLFSENKVVELNNLHIKAEKDIQKVFESNLEAFFKVKLVATEFKIGDKRIDTLGIMVTNSCVVPVIFEYKKDASPMHVLQAVGYDEVLKDRKRDFLYVMSETFRQSSERYNNVDFDLTKIVCVARKFEVAARNQAKRDPSEIILVEYDMYEDNLITLKLTTYPAAGVSDSKVFGNKKNKVVTQAEMVRDVVPQKNDNNFLLTENLRKLSMSSVELQNLNRMLESFIFTLGNVEKYDTKHYTGFRVAGGKLFADLVFKPMRDVIIITVTLPLEKVLIEEGFTRDISGIGHHGIGNIEIVCNGSKFEDVKRLIKLSYDNVNFN